MNTDANPFAKFGYFALKGGDWEEFESICKEERRATGWVFEEYERPLRKWQRMRRED